MMINFGRKLGQLTYLVPKEPGDMGSVATAARIRDDLLTQTDTLQGKPPEQRDHFVFQYSGDVDDKQQKGLVLVSGDYAWELQRRAKGGQSLQEALAGMISEYKVQPEEVSAPKKGKAGKQLHAFA